MACCEGILDSIRVAGTVPRTGQSPAVARNTAGPPVGVNVDCPLQKFMRMKVVERDLEGMVTLITTSDPMIRQLANTVTTFTKFHLERDATNEKRIETANKPNYVDDLLPSSKYK